MRQIELTEEDICGYDDGDNVELGDTIVYESKNGISDNIKETRNFQTKDKDIDCSSDIKTKLENIERELLSLDIKDSSESSLKRYNNNVRLLYKKIHEAYNNKSKSDNNNNNNNNNNNKDMVDDDLDTTMGIKIDTDLLDYATIQRITKLEQRVSTLEEAIGFDDDLTENTSVNIISRINKLYAHLRFLKKQLDKKEISVNMNTENNDTDKDSINTMKSFEKINKYSPYMDHIITRLENYSSIYDGMVENNLRLQQWDNKIDILIQQQNKWTDLLDKIEKKLESNK